MISSEARAQGRLDRLKKRARAVRRAWREACEEDLPRWRLELFYQEARGLCEALGRTFLPLDDDAGDEADE